MWKKISGKIVPTVLAWDREHMNVNLKNSYLTLWMYEEQSRYLVVFHTYLFVLIYIEDLGQVLVFSSSSLLYTVQIRIRLIYCSILYLDFIFNLRFGFNFLGK